MTCLARIAAVTASWLLAAATLSGCGAAEHVGDQTTPPSAGADDIVWQVTYEQGFTSTEMVLSGRPALTVYGDGRFLAQRRDDDGASPTVVTTFEEGRLTPEELNAVREHVADSHALDVPDPDLGDPAVMDAGTTSVRGLGPDGTAVELHAYALGIGGPDGLTTQQADLRARLDALIAEVDRLIPDHRSRPYEAERLEVHLLDGVSPFDGARPPAAWPGPSHRTLFTGQADTPACAVISGSDVDAVLEAAQHNPELSWTDPSGDFRAVVTIALPGDKPCAR